MEQQDAVKEKKEEVTPSSVVPKEAKTTRWMTAFKEVPKQQFLLNHTVLGIKDSLQRQSEDIRKIRNSLRGVDLEPIAEDLIRLVDEIESARDQFSRALNVRSRHRKNKLQYRFIKYLDGLSKDIRGTLSRHGIEEIAQPGVPFDAEIHRVMETVVGMNQEPMVKAVVRRGYRLNGRVLRPADVIASRDSREVRLDEGK